MQLRVGEFGEQSCSSAAEVGAREALRAGGCLEASNEENPWDRSWEGWGDAQPCLGEGGRQWDLAPAGDGAFGFGDPEVHQEGKMSTAGKEGSHSAAWEEMVGLMSGCFPAPEPWDCGSSWPVYRIDARIGWVVKSDGDIYPPASPALILSQEVKHLLVFPQAAPRELAPCPSLFGWLGSCGTVWGDQAGL